MKRYSDYFEEEFVDWESFLKKKNISENEWEEKCEFVNYWSCCPSGNLCNSIKRHESDEYDYYGDLISLQGQPKDEILKILGTKFSEDFPERNQDHLLNLVQLINLRGEHLVKARRKEKVLERIQEKEKIRAEIAKLDLKRAELEKKLK